jgi:hypothetical protein
MPLDVSPKQGFKVRPIVSTPARGSKWLRIFCATG